MIDAKSGGNLLYLPLDKLMQAVAAPTTAAVTSEPAASVLAPPAAAVSNEVPPQLEKTPLVEQGGVYSSSSRSRESLRSRERGDR
jgi:membrane protease subunit HflK